MGFTLVELIVVITILAILGTIGFIAAGGYQKNARDSKKISNIATIVKGFEISLVKEKPIDTSETSTGENIVISGSGLTMTGYYGNVNEKLLNSLSVFSRDLTMGDGLPYQYSYFPKNRKYQVLGTLEDFNNVPQLLGFLFDRAYADSETSTGYVYIKGNFVSTGSINSLFPDPTVWSETPPDENNLKTISGTGTLDLGSSIAQIVPPEIPLGGGSETGCTIGDTSLVGDTCIITL